MLCAFMRDWIKMVYGTLGLENITLGVRKTIMNMNISEIELNRISGWQLAPLRKTGMNGLVHDD